MTKDTTHRLSRRAMLMKLGLATGMAYVAPSLIGLDVARASSGSGGGSGGGSGASGPSLSSGPSRMSGPSRPHGSSSAHWRWDSDRNRFVRVQVRG